MLGGIRGKMAAARAADALELEQGLLRICLTGGVMLYLIGVFHWDGVIEPRERTLITMMGGVMMHPFILVGWMLLLPGVNQVRRLMGVVCDMVAMTLTMVLGDEAATIVYPLFLWVVIGNGFRFGIWHLHFAQALSLAGFAIVVAFGEFWHRYYDVTVALFVALVVIPMYVRLLLSRLQAVNEHLEEARGEAEAANAAKTSFLAAASHDLRQPMQALSMYTSVLEERVTEAASKRVVNGIQLSVKTLEQLFDSLLDVAQIESGVIRPKVGAFALMPLMEQVVLAELPLAAQKGLAVRVVATPAHVLSDPALLERMLKNLLTNAIRYTEKGGILVGCRRAGAAHLRLEVVDSGIGIPSREQERIFEEYYQVAGASGQGLGLGLTIVKSLGDLLGHRVALRSAPGRGSVFSIELQRVPPPAAAAEVPALPLPELVGASVVLVDDDVEIRDSVRLLLEGWGCRAVSGASAAEVEEKLRAQQLRPDALIVDYRLADSTTGPQVVERLRAVYGAGLPALMITGSPNAAVLQREFAGIPVALKPVPPGKLRAFISEALRQGRRSRAA
jgi:signal transduction histidine kinase/CheY-like chemotaxis protein